jgi:hypothetical protein
VKQFEELPASAQAAFAGLDTAARQADLSRSIADLPGGFAMKRDGARGYWYYQVKLPTGQPQQVYVGPDDGPTHRLMAGHAICRSAQSSPPWSAWRVQRSSTVARKFRSSTRG